MVRRWRRVFITSGFESLAIRFGRRVFDHAGTAEGGCRHMMPTTHDYKSA